MLSRREVVALTLLFLASLPAVTARLYSSDEVEYFSYLRSLWFDRDVSFENEYQYFYEHRIAQSQDFHHTFLELETATGRRINYGTIGCAILWAPLYAAADAITHAMRAAGNDVAADGYSRPYVAAVAYGSAFYGFAAIVLSILAARRVVGPFALSSGIAVWLGTPLLFYMYVAPPFSHACSAFAVALFVTIWLRVREQWTVSGAVALGLAGALMAMVREQDLFFVLGPALDFAAEALIREQRLRRERGAGLPAGARARLRQGSGGQPSQDMSAKVGGKRLIVAFVGLGAFALGYLPQLLAYKALNGKFGPSPLVTRKMYWSAPHALQVLADPEHGFFFWTPLAVLAVMGLVMLTVVPRLRWDWRIGACMLLMLALQVYISGAVESWTVAGAFGQRRFVSVTILLVVGLAALRAAVQARPARVALNAAIVLCLWWNVALMAAFGTSMMDRQRLELRRNAYDAFITLPRTAPGLAYRYFTERSSFYKPATEAPR